MFCDYAFVKVLNSVFHQRIPYIDRQTGGADKSEAGKIDNKYNGYSEKIENKPKVSPLYR